MGRKNLLANAAVKTAEMPSLGKLWPVWAVLVACVWIAFSPVLGNGFVDWDDRQWIVENHSFQYCHAPMMAWVVLGCAGVCRLAKRRWSPAALLGTGAGTLAATCGLMALCSAQCRVWDSSEHLWGQALEHAGWSSELHRFMGSSLAEEGKFERAFAEFREALRIRPHDFEATCDLGVALDRCGETDAAIACLREADRLRPKNPKVHLNLGAALVHRGRVDEAVALYREALALEAITELREAIGRDPQNPEAHHVLAAILVTLGRIEEAADEFEEVLRLRPDHAQARAFLAMARGRRM